MMMLQWDIQERETLSLMVIIGSGKERQGTVLDLP